MINWSPWLDHRYQIWFYSNLVLSKSPDEIAMLHGGFLSEILVAPVKITNHSASQCIAAHHRSFELEVQQRGQSVASIANGWVILCWNGSNFHLSDCIISLPPNGSMLPSLLFFISFGTSSLAVLKTRRSLNLKAKVHNESKGDSMTQPQQCMKAMSSSHQG